MVLSLGRVGTSKLEGLLAYEGSVRLGIFLGVLGVMALLETLFPRRPRGFKRRQRWFANFGVLVIASLLVRVLLPWLPVSVALYAQSMNIGLFNIFTFSGPIAVLLGVVFLDFCIYAQHVAMHKVPVLWRLHRMHHADLDYDVSTGIRFHPVEIFLSLFYKMALVLALGIDPVAVILFEVILNAMAMFNHANFKLPLKVDKILRRVIVTPDMHRVHHSSIQTETDSNYGFNVSLWDRLFKTYTAQPSKGHDKMTIGLSYFREDKDLSLWRMLLQPLRRRD